MNHSFLFGRKSYYAWSNFSDQYSMDSLNQSWQFMCPFSQMKVLLIYLWTINEYILMFRFAIWRLLKKADIKHSLGFATSHRTVIISSERTELSRVWYFLPIALRNEFPWWIYSYSELLFCLFLTIFAAIHYEERWDGNTQHWDQ